MESGGDNEREEETMGVCSSLSCDRSDLLYEVHQKHIQPEKRVSDSFETEGFLLLLFV